MLVQYSAGNAAASSFASDAGSWTSVITNKGAHVTSVTPLLAKWQRIGTQVNLEVYAILVGSAALATEGFEFSLPTAITINNATCVGSALFVSTFNGASGGVGAGGSATTASVTMIATSGAGTGALYITAVCDLA